VPITYSDSAPPSPRIAIVSARTHDYYVYIMTNRSYTSLYTGVTSDLARRAWQHRNEPTGFAKRYRTSILVYFEHTSDVWAALAREKQIKNLGRAEKIELIEAMNPCWHDLYETRVAPSPPPDPVADRMTIFWQPSPARQSCGRMAPH
jgi:putative endonuclease